MRCLEEWEGRGEKQTSSKVANIAHGWGTASKSLFDSMLASTVSLIKSILETAELHPLASNYIPIAKLKSKGFLA